MKNNLVIAFGDLHGCHAAAVKAVEISEELGAEVIFLGDYMHRWPLAIKMLNILIEAKKKHPE